MIRGLLSVLILLTFSSQPLKLLIAQPSLSGLVTLV